MASILPLLLLLLFNIQVSAEDIYIEPPLNYPAINPATAFSMDVVKSECLSLHSVYPMRCTVRKFGSMGSLDTAQYYFVLYESANSDFELKQLKDPNGYTKQYPYTNTVVIVFFAFDSLPSILRPLFVRETFLYSGWFEEPAIVTNTYGTFLHVRHLQYGTGHFVQDTLFRWQGSYWQNVDTQSWLNDLPKRLPKECGVWKGTVIDFARMTASNSVWKKSDGNCCPTCGTFEATLALQRDRIVIQKLTFDPKAPSW